MTRKTDIARAVQIAAFVTLLCTFGIDAAAVDIRWANWGKGREVASGKMVKWAVNKHGQVYLNNARNGWGWAECRRPAGFRALHVAAFGSIAFVAADDRRLVRYLKNPKNGACQLANGLAPAPVRVRDLAFDGQEIMMLGEDGAIYAYVNNKWVGKALGGRGGLTAFAQTARTAPGQVVCQRPDKSPFYLFVDARHGRAIAAGHRSRPAHKKFDHRAKPYGNEFIWKLERLDKRQCLFRLRDHLSGRYLIAGDNYDGGLYVQPHRNRPNAIWRLVSGLNGAVSLVDYKHGRAITAGNNYDGNLYHQELTPVSARAKITGRTNQWWFMKAVTPDSYKPVRVANGPKCNLPAGKIFRFDDLKHKRSLRWRDGAHGPGHLTAAAEWKLKKAPQNCFYYLLSKDEKIILIAGDNYDGRLYHKPNTAAWRGRRNAMWRFTGIGGNRVTMTDFKHKRQLIAGDNSDGRIYHQPQKGRANGKWMIYRVEAKSPVRHLKITGNGKANGIGVQPVRLSGDPYFKRWWLTGTNNAVQVFDTNEGWKPFDFEALDVHVTDEGHPFVLSPALKLYRPRTGSSAKRTWGNYQEITANAMRFDVDPLGYPIVIRHNKQNVISQTFPKRDGSVPGAGSCSGSNPWSFLSNFAKNQFNKMTSSVAGLAKGVASGDFDAMVTNMAKVGAFSAGGGLFDQSAFLGAVLQTIPVSQIQTIGKITANARAMGYQGFAQAVKGDAKELANTAKELGTAMSKGSFKGMGEAIVNNPSVRYYLLGPIIETDWSQNPMLIAMQIRAKYAIRAYQLKSRIAKYTPAGAAKHMATSAMVQAFQQHGPGFAKDILRKAGKLSKEESRAIDKVLAIAVQGMDQEIEAAAKGGVEPSPLYTDAVLKDTKAVFVWNDKGSGADIDGSFWRPKLDAGCISLGDLGQRGYSAPKMKQICNAAGGRGKWWDYPTGYEIIWSDRCSGADLDGSVWLPRCKPGYIAVGFVTNRASDHQPWRDRIACLKAGPNLATYRPMAKSQVRYTWNDKGSGAKQDVEILSRKFGGFPLMYAWPERKGLDHTRKTYHWSAIARIGDKVAAERALGLAKSSGPSKEYLND